MQINAQSIAKSPWLEIAKSNHQTGSAVNNSKLAAPTDTVTLSPASLALAKGESVEPEMQVYGSWPVWPSATSEVAADQ